MNSDRVIEIDVHGRVFSPFVHDGVFLGVVATDASCEDYVVSFEVIDGGLVDIHIRGVDYVLMETFRRCSIVSDVYVFKCDQPQALPFIARMGCVDSFGRAISRVIGKSMLVIECVDDCFFCAICDQVFAGDGHERVCSDRIRL